MKPHVKALRKVFQSRTQRGLLVAADNCEKCHISSDEVSRPLELHHKFAIKDVDPESGYDPNVQENLSTLCGNCHKAFHACYEELTFEQFIRDVPLDEMRQCLKDYRDVKARKRAIEAAKHRNRKRHG